MSEQLNKKYLLTEEEVAVVKQYFINNPEQVKLKRTDIKINGKFLSYSVVKGENNNFYAMYRSYRRTNNKKIKDDEFGQQMKWYGKGGFGIVKGAQNIDTGENVAVKIFNKDNKTNIEDVSKEADLQKKVDFFKDVAVRSGANGKATKMYNFMKIVPGVTLEELLQKDDFKYNSDDVIFRIILNILIAIQQMHICKVIHTDLGPQNIMVDQDKQANIIDFGCAVDEEYPYKLQAYNKAKNDYTYLAPEVRKDAKKIYIDDPQNPNKTIEVYPVTIATDIYSIGYLIREIITVAPKLKKYNKYKLLEIISYIRHNDPHKRSSLEEIIDKIQVSLLVEYLKTQQLDKIKQLLKDSPKIITITTIGSIIKINLEFLKTLQNNQLIDLSNYQDIFFNILKQLLTQKQVLDQKIIDFIKYFTACFPKNCKLNEQQYKDIATKLSKKPIILKLIQNSIKMPAQLQLHNMIEKSATTFKDISQDIDQTAQHVGELKKYLDDTATHKQVALEEELQDILNNFTSTQQVITDNNYLKNSENQSLKITPINSTTIPPKIVEKSTTNTTDNSEKIAILERKQKALLEAWESLDTELEDITTVEQQVPTQPKDPETSINKAPSLLDLLVQAKEHEHSKKTEQSRTLGRETTLPPLPFKKRRLHKK